MMDFHNTLTQTISRFVDEHDFLTHAYIIAHEHFNFYYPNQTIRDTVHRPLKHLEATLMSHQQAGFSFYFIPSSWIAPDSCMTTVRKKFLSQLCSSKHLEPYKEIPVYSRCYPEYFYFFEQQQQRIVCVINDTVDLSIQFYMSPFQHLFQVVMAVLNKHMTHAAAISDGQTGLLFAGASGAGKTTTTLTAILNNYEYVGEDYTILGRKNNELYASSIYNSIKLTENTCRLHDIEKLIEGPTSTPVTSNHKKVYFLSEMNSITIQRSVLIKSICSLSVGSKKAPSLEVISPTKVIKPLILSTLPAIPAFHSETIKNLYELFQGKKIYHLELGLDLQANIKKINWIFKQHAA